MVHWRAVVPKQTCLLSRGCYVDLHVADIHMKDQPRGLMATDYEVPGSISGSKMGIYPRGGSFPW
jgi:hypothetical protein